MRDCMYRETTMINEIPIYRIFNIVFYVFSIRISLHSTRHKAEIEHNLTQHTTKSAWRRYLLWLLVSLNSIPKHLLNWSRLTFYRANLISPKNALIVALNYKTNTRKEKQNTDNKARSTEDYLSSLSYNTSRPFFPRSVFHVILCWCCCCFWTMIFIIAKSHERDTAAHVE